MLNVPIVRAVISYTESDGVERRTIRLRRRVFAIRGGFDSTLSRLRWPFSPAWPRRPKEAVNARIAIRLFHTPYRIVCSLGTAVNSFQTEPFIHRPRSVP